MGSANEVRMPVRGGPLMAVSNDRPTAIWAITANGVRIGRRLQPGLRPNTLFCPAKFSREDIDHRTFDNLRGAIEQHYHRYGAHIFIMAAGIVVRLIAPYLDHKYTDPAVVVMDEKGRYAVSLVSGHVGGANALTRHIAAVTGAIPVITTATDVNRLPAIDLLAQQQRLLIENPPAVAGVNMAIIHGDPVYLYDPHGCISRAAAQSIGAVDVSRRPLSRLTGDSSPDAPAGVYIDYRVVALPEKILVLRPRLLTVGIGCNRGTSSMEIKATLAEVFNREGLSLNAIAGLASIDVKSDEPGLGRLAGDMGIGIEFFSKNDLAEVEGIVNPSKIVKKHVGVNSVCEAAAIRSARNGELIVPKQRTPNVTVAVARRPCLSSALAPGV